MFTSYQYKLYVKREQKLQMDQILYLLCNLRNAAQEEREIAWRRNKKSISYFDQCKSLKEIRKDDIEYNLPVTLLRGELKKVDLSYKFFFKRLKKKSKTKSKVGYPRYKKKIYSLNFTEFSGITFDGKFLYFKGVTDGIRVNLHRSIKGKIKACTIKKDKCGDWTVTFRCKVKDKKAEPTNKSVGLDAGLNKLLMTSDGDIFENKRPGKALSQELKQKQRLVSRAVKGSKSRKKKVKSLARTHRKIKNTRKTYLNQISTTLVKNNDIIIAEQLNLQNLMQTNLANSFGDAAIGLLYDMIKYKAERAGRRFIQVDPKYTSQECCVCGNHAPKKRHENHTCHPCKVELDRDYNAAINILNKGVVPLGMPKSVPANCFNTYVLANTCMEKLLHLMKEDANMHLLV